METLCLKLQTKRTGVLQLHSTWVARWRVASRKPRANERRAFEVTDAGMVRVRSWGVVRSKRRDVRDVGTWDDQRHVRKTHRELQRGVQWRSLGSVGASSQVTPT